MNITYLFDTSDKRSVFLYSLFSFGFLPLLYPLALIPFLASIVIYFIFGHSVSTAQNIFLQYRIELVPLLIFATIITCSKFKFLNKSIIGIYLLVCILIVQYNLHLPLSYLAKSWFWQEPIAVKSINATLAYLPRDASVVSQNNITPHISHRDEIFTLWPEKKKFRIKSPCKTQTCEWFSWGGHPEFLIIDTSSSWDARHLLANRADFLAGIKNLESQGIIKKYKQIDTAILFVVQKQPNIYR